MAIFALGILISGMLFSVFWIIKKYLAAHSEAGLEKAEPCAPFCVVDYMSHIEETCETLWEEPKEEYILILWWGLEGLRLNKDGTREWISKTNSPPKPRPPMASIMRSAVDPMDSLNMLQISCYGANVSPALAQALAMEAQITRLRLQEACTVQNQMVIQQLNHGKSFCAGAVQVCGVPCDGWTR